MWRCLLANLAVEEKEKHQWEGTIGIKEGSQMPSISKDLAALARGLVPGPKDFSVWSSWLGSARARRGAPGSPSLMTLVLDIILDDSYQLAFMEGTVLPT